MSHVLDGDGRHDGEDTRIPRPQASFILSSAKWVMALLLSIFSAVVVGQGWIVKLQLENSSTLSEIQQTLKYHAEKISLHDMAANDVGNLKTEVREVKSRQDMQGNAIVTASEKMYRIIEDLSALKSAIVENAANHVAVERRLSQLRDSFENLRDKEDRAHRRVK